jgi:hypothetical protein
VILKRQRKVGIAEIDINNPGKGKRKEKDEMRK